MDCILFIVFMSSVDTQSLYIIYFVASRKFKDFEKTA
jgi:hypothetical protein